MLLRTLMAACIMAHSVYAYQLIGTHVKRTPAEKSREMFSIPDPVRLLLITGDYEIANSVRQKHHDAEMYNMINDGTNPTRAVMLVSRYLYSQDFANHPEQNVANSTTARKAIEYSTDNSIPLDCLKVFGSNRDLCLAALNTPIGAAKCFTETPTVINDMFFDMFPDPEELALNPYSLDYLSYHVLRQPGEQRVWDFTIAPINITTDTGSYLKEYERINDGMNPTRAVVMRSRLFEIAMSELEDKTIIGPAEAMQRNSIHDKGTAYGAEYIARFSIELDCDKTSGPDREMCENIQKKPVLGLCLKKDYTTDNYYKMIGPVYFWGWNVPGVIGDRMNRLDRV